MSLNIGEIWGLLPLLDGWEFRQTLKKRLTIRAGKEEELLSKTERGWLLSVEITSNRSDILPVIQIGKWLFLDATIDELNNFNITQPSNVTYVPSYDTVLNRYLLTYAPATPTPYRDYIRVTVTTPTTASATLGVRIHRVKITSLKKLIKSIRRLQLE